jgi:Bacterial regulatory proteins, tetR family
MEGRPAPTALISTWSAPAAEVFAEQGTGAALDDIAKRAGTGNATLYRHFPARRDLVQAGRPTATTNCARPPGGYRTLGTRKPP